jgi:hypothetical protein
MIRLTSRKKKLRIILGAIAATGMVAAGVLFCAMPVQMKAVDPIYTQTPVLAVVPAVTLDRTICLLYRAPAAIERSYCQDFGPRGTCCSLNGEAFVGSTRVQRSAGRTGA